MNEFVNQEVKIVLPKGTLYNDLNFVYKKLPNSTKHQIQNNLTPLHVGFELSIKADSTITRHLSKALIINANGLSQGGYFENGWEKKAGCWLSGRFSVSG